MFILKKDTFQIKFMYDAETTEVACNILYVENILQVRTFKKQITLIRTLFWINLTVHMLISDKQKL